MLKQHGDLCTGPERPRVPKNYIWGLLPGTPQPCPAAGHVTWSLCGPMSLPAKWHGLSPTGTGVHVQPGAERGGGGSRERVPMRARSTAAHNPGFLHLINYQQVP